MVRSDSVLKSMMDRELREHGGAISPLSDQLGHVINQGRYRIELVTPEKTGGADEHQYDMNHAKGRVPNHRLPNPIEPMLQALLTPELAKEQEGIFIPPSAFCQCKSDSIRSSCEEEYTRNDVSLNAWGY